MREYEKGNIDIVFYLMCMGNRYLKFSKKRDLDINLNIDDFNDFSDNFNNSELNEISEFSELPHSVMEDSDIDVSVHKKSYKMPRKKTQNKKHKSRLQGLKLRIHRQNVQSDFLESSEEENIGEEPARSNILSQLSCTCAAAAILATVTSFTKGTDIFVISILDILFIKNHQTF
jgi:hypothetical protein